MDGDNAVASGSGSTSAAHQLLREALNPAKVSDAQVSQYYRERLQDRRIQITNLDRARPKTGGTDADARLRAENKLIRRRRRVKSELSELKRMRIAAGRSNRHTHAPEQTSEPSPSAEEPNTDDRAAKDIVRGKQRLLSDASKQLRRLRSISREGKTPAKAVDKHARKALSRTQRKRLGLEAVDPHITYDLREGGQADEALYTPRRRRLMDPSGLCSTSPCQTSRTIVVLPKAHPLGGKRLLGRNLELGHGYKGELVLVPFDTDVFDRLLVKILEELHLEIVRGRVRLVVVLEPVLEHCRTLVRLGDRFVLQSLLLVRGRKQTVLDNVVSVSNCGLGVLPLSNEVDVGCDIAGILDLVIIPLLELSIELRRIATVEQAKSDDVSTCPCVAQFEEGARVKFKVLRLWILAILAQLVPLGSEHLEPNATGLGRAIIDEIGCLGRIPHRDGEAGPWSTEEPLVQMRVKTFHYGEMAFDNALRLDVCARKGVAVTFPDSGLGRVDLRFDLADQGVFVRSSARLNSRIVPADQCACHVGVRSMVVGFDP
ncbi:hypothetical protein L1887_49914 [Cichorium endivia]|nr:hypothetical protein L1887_49914 [Cichorium endivia]